MKGRCCLNKCCKQYRSSLLVQQIVGKVTSSATHFCESQPKRPTQSSKVALRFAFAPRSASFPMSTQLIRMIRKRIYFHRKRIYPGSFCTNLQCYARPICVASIPCCSSRGPAREGFWCEVCVIWHSGIISFPSWSFQFGLRAK